MISFKLYYEQSRKTIALFSGGFKPPTKGHFAALQNLLLKSDEGVVLIGSKVRDELDITQDVSYNIWKIYATKLSKPVTLIKAPVTPVQSLYEYIIDHPNNNYIVGAGVKDQKDTRFNSLLKNKDKYGDVKIIYVEPQEGGIQATDIRRGIANKDPNIVDQLVPPAFINDKAAKDKIKHLLHIK